MELRVINYFLAVAREQNISKAAESLHLTQPTLSRQIKDLEDELGKKLFDRDTRKLSLTEDGILFRKRAEEIMSLVNKTKEELEEANGYISGDVYIGTGETEAISIIANICKKIQKDYPNIKYNFISDDASDVLEKLDKGLIDFGILLGDIDKTKYNYLKLPAVNKFGLLVKKNSPLAKKNYITFEDIKNEPLIISRQSFLNDSKKIFKEHFNNLNIIATYNLIYNASILVKNGIGSAITIDKLINVSGDSDLSFIPLKDTDLIDIYIIWKKYQIFSKPSDIFLKYIKNNIS